MTWTNSTKNTSVWTDASESATPTYTNTSKTTATWTDVSKSTAPTYDLLFRSGGIGYDEDDFTYDAILAYDGNPSTWTNITKN